MKNILSVEGRLEMINPCFVLLLTSFLLSLFCTSAGLSAQCWPEGFTHDTRPEQMWLSCELSPNPNPDREAGLWLQYDFGFPYSLTNSVIWNYNEPTMLELGVTRMAVDYSLDGQNWTHWGEIDLDLASGRRDYAGQAGPDFAGTAMRYVLFTVLSTGNGSDGACAGLAEVRFNLDATVSVEEPGLASALEVFPNPAEDVVDIRLDRNIQKVEVYDQQGRLLQTQSADGRQLTLDLGHLPAGVYHLRVIDREEGFYRQKLVLL
ncbi:MAG: T9SS type A sorting domain-containing protein [Bacteroidota bacterium]